MCLVSQGRTEQSGTATRYTAAGGKLDSSGLGGAYLNPTSSTRLVVTTGGEIPRRREENDPLYSSSFLLLSAMRRGFEAVVAGRPVGRPPYEEDTPIFGDSW